MSFINIGFDHKNSLRIKKDINNKTDQFLKQTDQSLNSSINEDIKNGITNIENLNEKEIIKFLNYYLDDYKNLNFNIIVPESSISIILKNVIGNTNTIKISENDIVLIMNSIAKKEKYKNINDVLINKDSLLKKILKNYLNKNIYMPYIILYWLFYTEFFKQKLESNINKNIQSLPLNQIFENTIYSLFKKNYLKEKKQIYISHIDLKKYIIKNCGNNISFEIDIDDTFEISNGYLPEPYISNIKDEIFVDISIIKTLFYKSYCIRKNIINNDFNNNNKIKKIQKVIF